MLKKSTDHELCIISAKSKMLSISEFVVIQLGKHHHALCDRAVIIPFVTFRLFIVRLILSCLFNVLTLDARAESAQMILVADLLPVPDTRNLGFGSTIKNWGLGKLNKVFLHFLPIFIDIFDDFSKYLSRCESLNHHQICQ